MKNLTREMRKKLVRMHRTGPHFGSAMSVVDTLAVLYFRILKIESPDDVRRDRFILSKGHAVSAWYVSLAKKGFFDEKILDGYLADGGKLYGHPVRGSLPGIEVSTGSLGHGLPVGVGMALAARNDKADWRVFVLMGDGEVQEGSVWEAAMLAARLKLDKLVAIIDANNFQGFDCVENVQPIGTFRKKFEAFGWSVKEVDGHNHEEIEAALKKIPFQAGKPSLLIAHTVKGKGVLEMEGRFESHYLSIKPEKVDGYLKELEEKD